MVYLVCFIMRSGSNYLCDMLKDAGLGNPTEYYFPYQFEERVSRPGFAANKRFNPQARTPREYFRNILESQVGPAAGIKCGWHSFQVMRDELGEYFETLNVRYIYLTRRDRLRQAISWYRAAYTQQWSRFDPPGRREPPYNRDEIAKYLHYIELQERSWEDLFSRFRVLRLTYEELDHETPQQVAHFLRLPAPRLAPSNYRVQRDLTTESWVKRYHDG